MLMPSYYMTSNELIASIKKRNDNIMYTMLLKFKIADRYNFWEEKLPTGHNF